MPPRTPLQVLSDVVVGAPDLQHRLLATTTHDEFVDLVCALAHERGLSLARDDVEAALVERRRARVERWI